MIPVNKDRLKKWLWGILGALLALQIYSVRELLAALLLFTVAFVVLLGLALVLYLVQQAGQLSLAWVEPRTRSMVPKLRGALALLEDLSKKPFRRPRSQPAP